jgi:hypothetical protein
MRNSARGVVVQRKAAPTEWRPTFDSPRQFDLLAALVFVGTISIFPEPTLYARHPASRRDMVRIESRRNLKSFYQCFSRRDRDNIAITAANARRRRLSPVDFDV